ncbi:MAG: hypothetical protein HYR91_04570 [Flavobacteriia bacterium]|nr:hypothetical protein [Flavobacteriia bacterium]
MKDIKPFHVTLFLASVLLVLAPLVYFTPIQGWTIGNLKLRFLSQEEFLHPKKQEKTDISQLVSSVDTSFIEVEKPVDLLKHQNSSDGSIGAPVGGELSAESRTQLIVNESALNELIKFFRELDQVANEKNKIHILHYGDSQIEGDRMTGYIRQRLQNQFGGNGPGLIPATNVYTTNTFKQTFSPNFMRYTCYGGEKLKNRRYGTMASAARFTAEIYDSIQIKSFEKQEGWIEIEPHKMAYRRAKTYNNVKLFYTSCIKSCGLKVYQNGKIIHEDSLITDGKYHSLPLSFATTPGKLRYVFSSEISPTICGFSLEGDYGVQVDNIAMRGCSGNVFGSIDGKSISQMNAELNSKLVILQFGGNSVPYFKDSSSVRRYAHQFQNHIKIVKKANPNATIIVIGPSDMSYLVNGIYETYPLLPYCVEQMKKVAGKESAAYWDLFAAMGGKNSMPSWVDQGLAGIDYIHFSHRGASIASQLFYEAFIAEYAKWKANGSL